MMFGMIPFDRRDDNLFDLFDNFEKKFFGNTNASLPAFRTDIRDQGDKFLLEAELPGFQKEDISLELKEGILTSYLHDRISAKHYGIPLTGNGRRESFRQMPIPRMRATYMEAGNMTEEEMISTVKKGIYASSFTNGQVQIGAGDFTFFVKDGYLIENGKLTQPIKDINIIGNGPRALADITMVGNNYKMDNGTWTCGKDGQSCPVTCGMPSALVSKLTVGGEN